MAVHRTKVSFHGPKVDYKSSYGAVFQTSMKGADNTRRAFLQLDKDVQYMVANAINKGVNEVYSHAKALAAEDTGRLKSQLKKFETDGKPDARSGTIWGSVIVVAESLKESIKHWILEYGGREISYDAKPFLLYVMRIRAESNKRRIRTAVNKALKMMRERKGK